ncbi:MAG: class I SAM-dependent methyltransferase, partial [Pseudonocardia sp.]|nr:class I SAM-dependent methyltransferase [Pseudonocardia sp.]
MNTPYDGIGHGYARGRRPDPRWAAAVRAAVGAARSVVDVGAGTGSYEQGLPVLLAVEPSAVMIAQRPPGAAPAVRAVAERIPLRDGAVDVALAVPTVHHWPSVAAGLAELRRVARRQVVLTF